MTNIMMPFIAALIIPTIYLLIRWPFLVRNKARGKAKNESPIVQEANRIILRAYAKDKESRATL